MGEWRKCFPDAYLRQSDKQPLSDSGKEVLERSYRDGTWGTCTFSKDHCWALKTQEVPPGPGRPAPLLNTPPFPSQHYQQRLNSNSENSSWWGSDLIPNHQRLVMTRGLNSSRKCMIKVTPKKPPIGDRKTCVLTLMYVRVCLRYTSD